MSLFTDGAMPLHKVTCIPRGHALGYVSGRWLISMKPNLISPCDRQANCHWMIGTHAPSRNIWLTSMFVWEAELQRRSVSKELLLIGRWKR